MSKILLDSADINKAKEIAKYYSIAGITTNPSILSKIDKPLEEKLAEIKEFAYDKYEIHVQTTENSAQKILEEAKELKEYFGETFFIKIPVTKEGNELHGAAAVIDKDWTSSLLAQEIDADVLVILTAVEKVAINFGKENEKWLDEITVTQAKEYVSAGEFAEGSMKPKVEAAIAFAESKKGRVSIITLLEKSKDGIAGKTGTRIVL